jgi:hypothetical protein
MAGNRIYQPSRGMPQDTVELSGRFTINGSSVVSAQTPSAGQCAFTVAKKAASTGVYVLTFDDTYPYILSVAVDNVRSSPTAETWKVSKIYDAAAAIAAGQSGNSTNYVEVTYLNLSGSAFDPTSIEVMVSVVITTHSE